jgi:hypothetical protein
MYAVYNIFLQRLATKFTVEISALNNYESEVPPVSDKCVGITYVFQVIVINRRLQRIAGKCKKSGLVPLFSFITLY